MAYEEVELMMSVVPGAMTGISTMMGGLVSINNVFMDITRQIDASFGLLDASIITASTVVAQLGMDAASAFGEFEQGLKVAQMVSGQTAQDMDYLRQKANEFSVSYRADIDQITEGLQTLGRAGLNSAAEQTEVLENGLSTAKLEGRELNSVLEELIQNTALLGGDLKSSNFGEDSKYVNDLLVATSMTAPITTHDVSETLKYSGGIAAAAGAKIDDDQGKAILEDYMGAIAAFAQKGVTGSIAGTALRAFLNKPATQDSSVVDALASIKLKPEYLWEDGEETMKPISEQIGIIQKQMDKLNVSTMDRLQIWSKIVGGKMGQQMMKLDSSSIKELTADIRAADDAESLASGTFETYQAKMKEVTEQGQVAFRQFGSYAAKMLTPILELVKRILEVFSNPVASLALFASGFSLIVMGINRVRSVIALLKKEFGFFKEAWTNNTMLYGIRPSTVRKNERFNTDNLGKKYPGINESVAYAKEKAIEREEYLKAQGYSVEEISILDASKKGRSSTKYMERAKFRSSNFLSPGQLAEKGLRVEDINDKFIIQELIKNKKWKPEYSKVYYESGQSFDAVFQKFGKEMVSAVYEIYEEPRKKLKEKVDKTVEKQNKKANNVPKELTEYAEKTGQKIDTEKQRDKVAETLSELSTLNDMLTEDEKSNHPILSKYGSYFDKSTSSLAALNKRTEYKKSNVAFDNLKSTRKEEQKKGFLKDLEEVIQGDISSYDIESILDTLWEHDKIEESEKAEVEAAIEERILERKVELADKYSNQIIKETKLKQYNDGAGYDYKQYALMDTETFYEHMKGKIPEHVDYGLVQEQLLKKAGIFSREQARLEIELMKAHGHNYGFLNLASDKLMDPYDNPFFEQGILGYNPHKETYISKDVDGSPIYENRKTSGKIFEKKRRQYLEQFDDTSMYLAHFFNLPSPLDDAEMRDYVLRKNSKLANYIIGNEKTGQIKAQIPKDLLFGPRPGLDDFADIDIGMGQTMSDVIGDKNTQEGRIQLRIEYENFLKWYDKVNKEINRLIDEEVKSLQNITRSTKITPKNPYKQGEKVTLKELNNVLDVFDMGGHRTKKDAKNHIQMVLDNMRDNETRDMFLKNLDNIDSLDNLNYRELQKVAQLLGISAKGKKDVLRQNIKDSIENYESLYTGDRPNLPPMPAAMSLKNVDLEARGISPENLLELPDEIGSKLFDDWDEFKDNYNIAEGIKEAREATEEYKKSREEYYDSIEEQIELDEQKKRRQENINKEIAEEGKRTAERLGVKKDPETLEETSKRLRKELGIETKEERQERLRLERDEIEAQKEEIRLRQQQIENQKEINRFYSYSNEALFESKIGTGAQLSASKKLTKVDGHWKIEDLTAKYTPSFRGPAKPKYDVVKGRDMTPEEEYDAWAEAYGWNDNSPKSRSIKQRIKDSIPEVSNPFKGWGDKIKDSLFTVEKDSLLGTAGSFKDLSKAQKAGNFFSNLISMLGGPFVVAIEGASIAIQQIQAMYEQYTQETKELANSVQEAYSAISSAESGLKQAYREANPGATNEDVENYILDVYNQRYEDFASHKWLDKTNIKNDKVSKGYEYDEEKDDGSYKEKEVEELTSEQSYEEAVKENTGALYAATAQLQASLTSLVNKMQDGTWGVDGVSSVISDALGVVSDNISHLGGQSGVVENGGLLLTASQKDSNYQGYTEMAGLMLEDFYDAKGNLERGLNTMFGKDSSDILSSMNSQGRDVLQNLANFASGKSWGHGQFRLTRTENLKMQQSMKMDKKSWQAGAKELAKLDMKRKAGKQVTEKDTKRLEGYIKKLATETGLSEIKIRQGLQLQQLQDMYEVAQQSMVPLAERQAQIAAQHLVFGESTAGSTSGTNVGANDTAAIASVIASYVSVIAQAKAGEAYFEAQRQKGDPDALKAKDYNEYLSAGYGRNYSLDDIASGIPLLGGVYSAQKQLWGDALGEGWNNFINTKFLKTSAPHPERFYGQMLTFETMGEKARNPEWTDQQAEENARRKLSQYFDGTGKALYNEDVISKIVRENYSDAITPTLLEEYMGSDIGETDNTGSGGSGGSGGDSGDKDKGNRKERVDLVLCNKKEIPKLNVNLFKKPPTFTVLNKNFKVRDVKINTEDTPKAIMSSIKNAFIDVQKRSDPKIIQDESAEYDPVAATDGNSLPSGTSKPNTS